MNPLPAAGTVLHGFVVTGLTPLSELNVTLVQLRHERTGARYLHVAAEDPNNLCAIGFRTPPADSTGVAHILEHTTLCGSRRYPVRDPFFAMVRRSLNTFMNAMTASDWTFYPFASQNPQDVTNLLSIYLDAVFFPLLREDDFRQEGHRLEFADPADPSTPLVRRGVVYNEMQGAMASPASLLYRRAARCLYPTTTYRFNSGGEPAEIPALTWHDLKKFHDDYYHPSNAWFYSYGNLPLERHLQQIESEALCHFYARPVDSRVEPENGPDGPLRISDSYPVDTAESSERKVFVQLGWLCCDVGDSFERLAMTLLSSLLLGNPGAPLYKALIESRLGENLSPGSGYHDDNRTTAFFCGLQGCSEESAGAVEALICATLEEVAATGFTPERIAGAIHRLEFEHREVSGNGTPYPLSLLFRTIGPWLHNDDPVTALRIAEPLAKLKAALGRGNFLEELIRTRLLKNPRRIVLTLLPDAGMRSRQEAELIAELAEIKKRLTPEEEAALIRDAARLQAEQEAPADFSSLPTLTRADIPAQEVPLAAAAESDGVIAYAAPANGIGYLIGHFAADRLPAPLQADLSLWATLLPQLGAGGCDYAAMAERIEAMTGGIQITAEILDHLDSLDDFISCVQMRGKALVINQRELCAILADLFLAADTADLTRLRNLLGQMRSGMENSLVAAGHSYAARFAAAGLTPAAQRREAWGGVTLLRRLRQLTDESEALPAFSSGLAAIGSLLVDRLTLRLGLTGEERHLQELQSPLPFWREKFPAGPERPKVREVLAEKDPVGCGLIGNTPVNFVARVWRTVPSSHVDAAPLAVLAKLLRSTYLHREIREKGGAYGGLAAFDNEAGLFSCLSYRDPQIARTLGVYDDALLWAANGNFTAADVDEALLAVFADLDRPLTPGGRGNREFVNRQQGLSIERRQLYRDQLLAVRADDLVRVAQTRLIDTRSSSRVAVIGSEEALLRANAELGEECLRIEKI